MQSLVQNASGKALEETKTYKNNNQPVQMMIIYYITYSNCMNPGFPLEKGPFFGFKVGCFWQATVKTQVYHSLTSVNLRVLGWGLLNLAKLHVLAVSPTLWQPLGLINHWFPLISPAIKPLFPKGGTLGGVGGLAMIT